MCIRDSFWGSVFFLGAVASVGAYGLLNFANATRTNSEASLIGNIGTVVSVLAGVLLLKSVSYTHLDVYKRQSP